MQHCSQEIIFFPLNQNNFIFFFHSVLVWSGSCIQNVSYYRNRGIYGLLAVWLGLILAFVQNITVLASYNFLLYKATHCWGFTHHLSRLTGFQQEFFSLSYSQLPKWRLTCFVYHLRARQTDCQTSRRAYCCTWGLGIKVHQNLSRKNIKTPGQPPASAAVC